MGYLVRLKPNWPGPFRRSVRRDPESREQVLTGGEIVGVLEFAPGETAELTEEEYRAVAADIDVSLENVALDDKGRPRAHEGPYQVPDEPASEDDDDPPDDPPESDAGEAAGLAIKETTIPKPLHEPLQAAGLGTLEEIDAYVAGGNKLSAIKGIGEPSAKKILEALDYHRAQPGDEEQHEGHEATS